jgi:hypothetical protein
LQLSITRFFEFMQLLVAVNCSSLKTASPIARLRARSLPRGSVSDLAAEWTARCAAAREKKAVGDLYSGRSFRLATDIAASLRAPVRIISAGMGMLDPAAQVSPYSLTVSPGTPDCILQRASHGKPFTAARWWHSLEPRRRAFAKVLREHPRGLLLLALTRPYLEMVVEELVALPDRARARLRIVGLTRAEHLPTVLQAVVMPYDARLNDATRTLRGTAYDFPIRALAHFVDLIKHDRRADSATAHARRIRQSLARLTAPVAPMRRRVDGATLQSLIKRLKARGFSRTAALQHLRATCAIACEYGRFARAWDAS